LAVLIGNLRRGNLRHRRTKKEAGAKRRRRFLMTSREEKHNNNNDENIYRKAIDRGKKNERGIPREPPRRSARGTQRRGKEGPRGKKGTPQNASQARGTHSNWGKASDIKLDLNSRWLIRRKKNHFKRGVVHEVSSGHRNRVTQGVEKRAEPKKRRKPCS